MILNRFYKSALALIGLVAILHLFFEPSFQDYGTHPVAKHFTLATRDKIDTI